MKTRWLLLGCLVALVAQAQDAKRELWMWKDAKGVVHYSDVPGPGATKVNLTVTEGQSSQAATSAQGAGGSTDGRGAAAAKAYTSLVITEPANEASFFGADTVVTVRVRPAPALSAGDTLLVYLDDTQIAGQKNELDFRLAGLERGEHTLTAVIQDADGEEKIRSASVVFYIKQPTIIPPAAVGPNVKPLPTARPKRGG